jgi:hypothetical protein
MSDNYAISPKPHQLIVETVSLAHNATVCVMFTAAECNGNGELIESEAALLCVQCKDSFSSAWDLMVHVQAAHMLNIYELGVPQRRARSTSSSHHEDVIESGVNQQNASSQQQQVVKMESSPQPATPPAPAAVCPVPADKEVMVSSHLPLEK